MHENASTIQLRTRLGLSPIHMRLNLVKLRQGQSLCVAPGKKIYQETPLEVRDANVAYHPSLPSLNQCLPHQACLGIRFVNQYKIDAV